jgi:hypothetical protein
MACATQQVNATRAGEALIFLRGPTKGPTGSRWFGRIVAALAISGVFIAIGVGIDYVIDYVNEPAAKRTRPGGNGFMPMVKAILGEALSPEQPMVKAILGEALSPEQETIKRYVLRNSLSPDSIHFEKWFPAKNASLDDSNAITYEEHDDPQVQAELAKVEELIRTITYPVTPQHLPIHPNAYLRGTPPYFPLGATLPDGRRITGEELRRMHEKNQHEWSKYYDEMSEAEGKREKYQIEADRLSQQLTFHKIRHKVPTADRVVRVISRTSTPITGTIRWDSFYYLKDGKVVKDVTGTPASHDELINLYYPGED